ncbi:integral membrane protein [Penicillium malachiteum]|nr:integral membrane protein [Penicillium malachiteum]
MKEALTASNVTHTECGDPVRDDTSLSITVPAAGMSIFVVLLILRLYARLVVGKMEMGLDDWATIFLGCCAVPVNVGSITLGKAGLGKDIWTLEFNKITRVLYLFYIQEMIYIICVALVKICFLLFYLRIFPSDRTRRIIKLSIAVTLAYGLAFLFVFAFQCSPVSYNWNSWDGTHEGSCVQTNTMVVTAAALNIVLDVWVIALPIPQVLKLQASITTKIQVVFMFSVGFLITGVGIYRAVMLKMFANSTNPTWDDAAGGYWSVIEIDVGIFCLCMPALRSLLGRLIPSVFGTARDASNMHTSSQKKIRASVSGRDTSFVHLVEMDHLDDAKLRPDT